MSAPDFFEVAYAINPWMEPARWTPEDARLRHEARAGWDSLKACYERLGAVVELQPPAAGQPDLVFTANAALVVDRRVLLARFRHAERQGEQALGAALFEKLRARGLVDSLHQLPEGVFFEGAGDAVVDAGRGIVWMGHGPRTSLAARRMLEQVAQRPVLALQLADPRYYHLDTCLCLLSGGELMVHGGAFTPEGLALLRSIAGPQLIEVPEDDARALAVNAVCIGRDVVMGHCSPVLRHLLRQRGYRTHVVPLEPFRRSGGSACCLTLALGST